MITDKEIKTGLDKAYAKAGTNAYFGNGFEAGVKFATDQLLKNNKEIAIDKKPCEYCNRQKYSYDYHDFCGKCGLAFDR